MSFDYIKSIYFGFFLEYSSEVANKTLFFFHNLPFAISSFYFFLKLSPLSDSLDML